ncbi:MAG: 50S ribosomal protein L11 methyltransferase [Proteobacteria bacterium]|nr:50S ribosomal protein L11 methyltransferase [Pseudomonadota bacterium]
MKDFFKEFLIYFDENTSIHPFIAKINNLSFIIKRHNVLSIFAKSFKEEQKIKKLITGFNFKEFLLRKEEIPNQNLKEIKIENFIIKRAGKICNKSIFISPGIAFGYDHPATILTAKKLIQNSHLFYSQRVLDVGIGSGILSIIMAKKGANKIIAIDICPFVVKEALKNIRKNRIRFKKIKVLLKDITQLRKKFSFIVANVPINVHLLVASKIKSLISKDGAVLLGGILKNEVKVIEEAYNEFKITDFSLLEDWATILLKPNTNNKAFFHR